MKRELEIKQEGVQFEDGALVIEKGVKGKITNAAINTLASLKDKRKAPPRAAKSVSIHFGRNTIELDKD